MSAQQVTAKVEAAIRFNATQIAQRESTRRVLIETAADPNGLLPRRYVSPIGVVGLDWSPYQVIAALVPMLKHRAKPIAKNPLLTGLGWEYSCRELEHWSVEGKQRLPGVTFTTKFTVCSGMDSKHTVLQMSTVVDVDKGYRSEMQQAIERCGPAEWKQGMEEFRVEFEQFLQTFKFEVGLA